MTTAHLLHGLIDAPAARTPDATALVHRHQALTYAELAGVRDRFAAALQARLRPGARVGLWAGKSIELVAAAFAVSRAGMVFVPINPALKAGQVGHIARDCGIELLVTSADRLATLADELPRCPALREVVLIRAADHAAVAGLTVQRWEEMLGGAPAPIPATGDDVAAVLYTSGSTGMPKGVVVPHRSLVSGAHAVASYLGHTPDDRILAAMPLSFDAGFSQLTTAFAAGACAVLMDYLLPAEVTRAVAEHRITGLCGVPPFWMQMTGTRWPPEAARSLRYFATTGGRMPRETVDRLRALLPNAAPYLMYGLTEAFRSTWLPPADIDRKAGSIGRAIPGQQVYVARADGTPCGADEPGELVHRGSTVCLGYWGNPAATAERFRRVAHPCPGVVTDELVVFSGDKARMDADGYLYFIGREDEMIKSSGYRISPVEIEEAVYASGLVRQAIAHGIDDERLGHRIGLVVHAPGSEDTRALIAACHARLPGYMVPADVVFAREPLPTNPNGKIDRKATVARLGETWAEAA